MNGSPWWRDRRIWIPVLVAVTLRIVVTVAWPYEKCIRDECMYLFTEHRMAAGEGMTASNGWLWAPGYVFLLYLHDLVTFGYPAFIKVTQAFLSGGALVILFRLGQRVVGERGATVAAWFYSLSPTLVFFSSRLWSETVYATLLLGALLSLLKAREGGSTARALLPGFLVGCGVLLRGVATYMLPIFMLGLLWDRWRERKAWVGAVLLALAAILTVAPYSTYATLKFGTLVISDRTMGQMLWLGDNDFEPVTFDVGSPFLSDSAYARITSKGRPHCAPKDEPITRDLCETEAGFAWIRANPEEFARRIPLRLAQLFTPHSFLTRSLRMNGWKGLPHVVDETLCVLVVAFSLINVLGGALGAWARGLKGQVVPGVVLLITAYHVAAIAMLAGLSRYRLPLDTLWILWMGAFLADPRASLAAIGSRWWKIGGALVTLAILIPLMLWFLPSGFPGWKTW